MEDEDNLAEKLLSKAKRILVKTLEYYGSFRELQKARLGDSITTKEVEEFLIQFCHECGLKRKNVIIKFVHDLGVRGKVRVQSISKNVSPENRMFTIIVDDDVNLLGKSGLESFANHEVGTHLLRSFNEGLQPWAMDRERFGLKKVNSCKTLLATEEGLASINTVLPMKKNAQFLWNPALLYYATSLAKKYNFNDLDEKLKEFIPNTTRRHAVMNRCRNSDDLDEPSSNDKLLVYFEGVVALLESIGETDFRLLMTGKLALESLPRIRRLARVNSIPLPRFMHEIMTYQKQLIHMAILNDLLPSSAAKNIIVLNENGMKPEPTPIPIPISPIQVSKVKPYAPSFMVGFQQPDLSEPEPLQTNQKNLKVKPYAPSFMKNFNSNLKVETSVGVKSDDYAPKNILASTVNISLMTKGKPPKPKKVPCGAPSFMKKYENSINKTEDENDNSPKLSKTSSNIKPYAPSFMANQESRSSSSTPSSSICTSSSSTPLSSARAVSPRNSISSKVKPYAPSFMANYTPPESPGHEPVKKAPKLRVKPRAPSFMKKLSNPKNEVEAEPEVPSSSNAINSMKQKKIKPYAPSFMSSTSDLSSNDAFQLMSHTLPLPPSIRLAPEDEEDKWIDHLQRIEKRRPQSGRRRYMSHNINSKSSTNIQVQAVPSNLPPPLPISHQPSSSSGRHLFHPVGVSRGLDEVRQKSHHGRSQSHNIIAPMNRPSMNSTAPASSLVSMANRHQLQHQHQHGGTPSQPNYRDQSRNHYQSHSNNNTMYHQQAERNHHLQYQQHYQHHNSRLQVNQHYQSSQLHHHHSNPFGATMAVAGSSANNSNKSRNSGGAFRSNSMAGKRGFLPLVVVGVGT
eukprot:TRINITY_DN18638_c0_g2_i1.p1 TRINITY_DN18638_c0_g2~~TRINITY_DN18638_c0_g2_i1.p1  ORF type:complete len:852 (-),score=209.54 TRINITY_DN18638_c0_g2_i1:173-2728(-)